MNKIEQRVAEALEYAKALSANRTPITMQNYQQALVSFRNIEHEADKILTKHATAIKQAKEQP